jgi:hypothetical protein
MRAPTVKRGQALTASLWNRMAGAVNGGISEPRDLDEGVTAAEQTAFTEREVSRREETVRIFNPNDAEQWVDVDRPTSITWRVSDGRTVERFYS